ncbi:MAG: alpha/beta hydrolase [Planctomycetota bacterium]|nr:alpha/beta hydrolase [Planctomycetota bacterium]
MIELDPLQTTAVDRRTFLVAATALATTSSTARSAPKVRVTTHTYKTVKRLPIKLDLHRPDTAGRPRLVVWIHGGALINGHRAGISGRVKTDLLGAGYALASIDYRLAPETPMPEILGDVVDAFEWLRERADDLKVDTSKIAVLGGSAGGYLTLATGYRVKPRPACLVPFWGYGDLVGDWYSKPSPHKRHNRVKFTETHARKQVAGPPVSDSRLRKGNGGDFYNWCRQTGRWPLEVSGWDPHTEPEKFYPYMPVKNVTADYPPTLLIHGTADTDVPYEQSVLMQREFKKHGVSHRLVSITGGEHGLGGGDPQAIDDAYKAALAFVKKHTG